MKKVIFNLLHPLKTELEGNILHVILELLYMTFVYKSIITFVFNDVL